MIQEKDFLIVSNFQSPYVVMTGNGRNPQSIQYRAFAKGSTIRGKLHSRNGIPAFILVDGTYVIPLNVVKEVITKDIIVSNAEGTKKVDVNAPGIKITNNKIKYMNAAIVGAAIGFGINYYAEKKGYLPASPKNKFIGMGIGAALTAFFYYQYINKK